MTETNQQPTTQRAYTLRLRGVNPSDTFWRDALWATHEAANKGAKVFGDWLLTLRGGLSHQLANEGPADQRKDRRILLALSWLSVEDSHGAPAAYVDPNPVQSLESVLELRGLEQSELKEWLDDCRSSLSAAIREDAVWVNRSAAFDVAAKECPSLTRDEIWDFLEPFFVNPKSYLLPAKSEADGEANEEAPGKEDKAKDLVQKTGGWLSSRFGSGKGANFQEMRRVYVALRRWTRRGTDFESGTSAIQDACAKVGDLLGYCPVRRDADSLLKLISGPGYKSATQNAIEQMAAMTSAIVASDFEKLRTSTAADAKKCRDKTGGKGPRPYAEMIIRQVEAACGFTYLQTGGAARHREFSVMLDHAARRVNVAHSWIKNAEAERRQFEADAQRMGNVPPVALAWLESYCADRAKSSGAIESYRIRKRAVDGWEQVVERWSRGDCKTPEDRIVIARALQDEIEKFGDIQLFESLAADTAECVWKRSGMPSAQPLKDFVFATDATAKKLRFKVPAYRHPDPLRHPVFTDFGNSRWDIEFSAHRAPTELGGLTQKVATQTASLAAHQEKRNTVNAAKRESLDKRIIGLRDDLERTRQQHASMADRHHVALRLWNGKTVETAAMRWSSKRLIADLSLNPSEGVREESAISVTRADRLGRAAAGVGETVGVSIAGLFKEDDWNGRLQAPRSQLDAIARRVDEHGWDAKAQTMVQRIKWLLSFSAKLTPQGPWTTFAERLGLKPQPQYWPHAEANKKRQGHGRLILSRLPGLRILSVDLGHRFAAACAVWEAMTTGQVQDACRTAGVTAPSADAMYLHLKGQNAMGRDSTTIYRRIGPDVLPDGSVHPAPWARLDRQFLIKLQGEDKTARKASPDEIHAVEQFEAWAGRLRGIADPPRKLAVDALMSETVRTARLAIARHLRRARIARNLIAVTESPRGNNQPRPLTDDARLKLLRDTLFDWHSLSTDDRWDDSAARRSWNERMATLADDFQVQRSQSPPAGSEPSKADRKKEEESLRNRLEPLAKTLAAAPKLRQELHDEWALRWHHDDREWQKKLKWLSRWLMPRGGERRDASRRHVGGLSLVRLGTLTEFRRKVQVGFFTRMKPDGSRDEFGPHFGQSTLDAIEKLKDNRVKQLASRIVEAALGVGIEHPGANGRDLQRARQRINDPRFAPCHAVIIEDLSHYRPEETRTRRENRATMDWRSAEARKRLEDACQLHGLHLRDVNPQYTSRQDSRTGAPGARAVEVQAKTFLTWRKQIAQAERKRQENKGDARDTMLLDIHARYKDAIGSALNDRLCIPLKGGDLFVSSDPKSPAAAGIQADLNAAANIGLRALMDPDFSGKWWYVPCDPKTKIPKADKVKGGLLDNVGPLAPATIENQNQKSAKVSKSKTREVINLWRDPSALPITGAEHGDLWSDTIAYWNRVQMDVVKVLSGQRSKPGYALEELPF
ncbi:MAG: type V CRISPR-associated protein Cas12b [Tepidisphaeraceae bacterium]